MLLKFFLKTFILMTETIAEILQTNLHSSIKNYTPKNVSLVSKES